MSLDSFSRNHQIEQQESEFVPNQYPGYLLPDGSWRYGVNAKTIADAAWAGRRSGALDRGACYDDADRHGVAQ
jgi:hypothetical protein